MSIVIEMTGARSIPGFSSDAIRADQARSTKRGQTGPSNARAAKLKAVEAAKSAYRRKKTDSTRLTSIMADPDGAGGVGTETMNGERAEGEMPMSGIATQEDPTTPLKSMTTSSGDVGPVITMNGDGGNKVYEPMEVERVPRVNGMGGGGSRGMINNMPMAVVV